MAKDKTSGRPSKQMNPLSRLVARAGVSIRAKLLVALSGHHVIDGGAGTVWADDIGSGEQPYRKLIWDQQRIGFFSDLYSSLGEARSIMLALSIEREFIESEQGAWFGALGWAASDRTNEILRDVNVSSRRIGKPGMPDEELIASMSARLRALQPLTTEINRARQAGDWQTAAQLGRTSVFDRLRAIQGDAYTRAQLIENGMAETAKITAQAFLASRQQVVAAALIAIGLALLTGFALSSALTWPVRRIGETLSHVASGGFDARVSVPNRDEMGGLAENVNTMSRQLGALYETVEAQKTELEGLNTALESRVAVQVDEIERTNRLRRFLPAQVADLIVQGDSEADMLGTKRGEVTVLFADLRGFTAFSNAVPPAQVIGALNAFHASAGPVVEAHGGTIERFLGDGVMVLFGAPIAMEDAAQRAVDAAIAMIDAVEKALAEFGTKAGAMRLGIGIGSGVATLGQIGFEGRQDYSAIGPAPNLAARLCDIAEGGQILMSHATAWQVITEMEPAGPFELKGIGPEVAAFEVVRKG